MLLNAKSGSSATAAATSASEETRLLHFDRVYTQPGMHPFDQVQWEKRDASITNEKGEVIFEQPDVEVPESWSMLATNVVVSKYFRRSTNGRGREKSVRQLIGRVVDTIHRWGQEGGYFATPEVADTFKAELTHLLVDQKAAFNSPVWLIAALSPSPNARHVSSTRWKTAWKPFWIWPRRKACFSSEEAAPAPISPRFVPPRSCFPVGGRHPARSPS